MNVNTTELAKILGITRQYVNKLVVKEGFPKAARGKYELEKAVKWYIGYVKNETDKKYQKRIQFYERNDSQQRFNLYRADQALLDLLERQNILVPSDTILRTWKEEITAIKQKLYSIPGKISVKCLSAQSKNEINDILTKSINEALENYANGTINIPSTDTQGNNPSEFISDGERIKNIHKTQTTSKRK